MSGTAEAKGATAKKNASPAAEPAAPPAAPADATAPTVGPDGKPIAPASQPEPADEQPLSPEDAEKVTNDDPTKNPKAATIPEDVPPSAAELPHQRPTKASYPVALSRRPITLTRNTAEATLDAELTGGGKAIELKTGGKLGPWAREIVRLRFGVTQDFELEIGYGVGSQRLSPPDGARKLVPGKQFEVGAAYTILAEHLGVSVAVPMYSQPYAASLTIGLPFRFNIGDRLAIVGGQDLVQVALGKWPNDLAQPEATEAYVLADQTHTQLPSGNINIQFGAVVQIHEDLAVSGTFRVLFPDFSTNDGTQSFWLAITKSAWRFDISGRVGFADLSQGKSIGIGLFAALRL